MLHPIDDSTPEAKKAGALLECIVKLANIDADIWCFFTKKVIWGLSLYLELGSFQVANWSTYPRISDAARAKRDRRDSTWKKEITFEHVRTLHDVQNMLKSEARSDVLTVNKAAKIIGEYPPMLITKDEDKAMIDRARHFKRTGTPEERYLEIPFSGFTLRSAGWQQ
jgi:hypothetical protein